MPTVEAFIQKTANDVDGIIIIDVLYSDGTAVKVLKNYRISTFNLSSFKQIVRDQIAALEGAKTIDQVLPLGKFDPT